MKTWEIYKAIRTVMHMTKDERVEDEFLESFDVEVADAGFVDDEDVKNIFNIMRECLKKNPNLVYNKSDIEDDYDVSNCELVNAICTIIDYIGGEEKDCFYDLINRGFDTMLAYTVYFTCTLSVLK